MFINILKFISVPLTYKSIKLFWWRIRSRWFYLNSH